MKIIRNRTDVLKRMKSAGATATPVLCPNAETPEEMEGILIGAQRYAEKRDAPRVVVGIGVTASYPDHPQLGRLAAEGSLEQAAETWMNWLEAYADRDGLSERVEVIPFLDHGWVPLEADLRLMRSPWFQDAMGIILFDASLYDFDQNAAMTASYVAEAGGKVVIEACPDKIYERVEIERKNIRESEMLSDAARVREFVRRTGVDLIVPNLGTEHRTQSTAPLDYRRDIARGITREVGPIQALHGTSSLGDRIQSVGQDGVCKVNFYTAMTRDASARVKAGWDEIPADQPLPIFRACGGAIHVARRNVFAEKTQSMMELLVDVG